jgi:hypothetical protein
MRMNIATWATCGLLTLGFSLGEAEAAAALEPFVARYEVLRDGSSQGEAEMRLERIDGARWRYTTEVRGTSGMARLSGFSMREVTELTEVDGRLQPQTASAEGGISLRRRSVQTAFDWTAGEVRWSGDVKDDQTGPAPLSARTVNPQLLNLALAQGVRDGAEAGSTLSFDLVNRGDSDTVEYRVRGEEDVQVPIGERAATTLHHRRTDKDREITVWIDPQLPPAPLRVLQRDDGKDSYELRLIEVR